MKYNILKIGSFVIIALIVTLITIYGCKKNEDENTPQSTTKQDYEYKVFESPYLPDFFFQSKEDLLKTVDSYSQLYNIDIRFIAKTIKEANISWKQMEMTHSFSKSSSEEELTLQKLDELLYRLQFLDPLSVEAEAILSEICSLLNINIAPDNPFEWMDNYREIPVREVAALGQTLLKIEKFENLSKVQKTDCIVLAVHLMEIVDTKDGGPSFVPFSCPCYDAYYSTWVDLTVNFGIDAGLCLLSGPFAVGCAALQGAKYLYNVEQARKTYVNCRQTTGGC